MNRLEKRGRHPDRINLLFFIVMLAAGGFGILWYCCRTGNTPQIYDDVVSEYTAELGSNKSAERSLFYIFSIAGAVIYALFYLIFRANRKPVSLRNEGGKRSSVIAVMAPAVFSVVHFAIYTEISWILIAALVASAILYLTDQDLAVPGTAFLCTCIYALFGIYRSYVFLGSRRSLSLFAVSAISLAVTLIILALGGKKRKTFYLRGILLTQLAAPFVLLVFLASAYRYQGEYTTVDVLPQVKVLIAVVIAVFAAEAVWKLFRCWKRPYDTRRVLTNGVCIAIMSFNQFSGTGAVMSDDLHHPYENIIGFYEIFKKGMDVFQDYIPISGLYSVVEGAVYYFFGEGKASFWFVTNNLFYLLGIILIVILLKAQLKGEWVLLISLLFVIFDYNRVVLILPVMLLLSWPKLIEKKNLWLQAWMLTSYLHGLYYPILGAAVCLGFLPLGLWQIVSYIRSGMLRENLKKPLFWLSWMICLFPVFLGIPLLKGTLVHTLAMGSQTVYADGLTRFGQTVPEEFFSYLKNLPVRLVLYYLCSFLIVISIVWVSVALCFKAGGVYRKGLRIRVRKPVPACLSLSVGILFLVAFSYTVIRMDIDRIYSRNEGLVSAAFVMITLIAACYLKHAGHRNLIVGFAVFLIAVSSSTGLLSLDSSSKLDSCYEVSDDYVYVEKDDVKNLEGAFVKKDTYETIETAWDETADLDKDKTYLGIFGDFGLYQLCDLKGGAEMELEATIKGYDAAQEAVDMARDNEMVIGTELNTVRNYYLYYWLLTSGEYVWQPDQQVFTMTDGSLGRLDVLKRNKENTLAAEGRSLGKTAGSWGSSMDSLSSLFTEDNTGLRISREENEIQIRFRSQIDGTDADFLYLEFKNQTGNYQYTLFNQTESFVQRVNVRSMLSKLMKKDYNRDCVVQICWKDDSGSEQTMNCRMERGKLLIPLGSGKGWLLNQHKELSIHVISGEEFIAVPELDKIQLLKLREVR